jgi:hypothetical protein
MYGRWVTVDLGDNIECRVWVHCTPDDSEEYLQKRARAQLIARLVLEED